MPTLKSKSKWLSYFETFHFSILYCISNRPKSLPWPPRHCMNQSLSISPALLHTTPFPSITNTEPILGFIEFFVTPGILLFRVYITCCFFCLKWSLHHDPSPHSLSHSLLGLSVNVTALRKTYWTPRWVQVLMFYTIMEVYSWSLELTDIIKPLFV